MKRGGKEMSLLYRDNSSIRHGSKDLCISFYRLDNWRADENGVIIILCIRRLLDFRNIQIRFERINLTTKRVPFDLYIHKTKQWLVTTDIFRQEDRACTGSPDRVALTELFQRFHQVIRHRQLANRCRFPARDDQSIQPMQLFR